MKIKANQALKNLKGEVLKNGDAEVTIGEALGNILLGSKTGGKMKLFNLAQKLSNQKEVEVDSSDLALIKQAAESDETYSNLVSGQVLDYLSTIKE
jgi:hypothetical protein